MSGASGHRNSADPTKVTFVGPKMPEMDRNGLSRSISGPDGPLGAAPLSETTWHVHHRPRPNRLHTAALRCEVKQPGPAHGHDAVGGTGAGQSMFGWLSQEHWLIEVGDVTIVLRSGNIAIISLAPCCEDKDGPDIWLLYAGQADPLRSRRAYWERQLWSRSAPARVTC